MTRSSLRCPQIVGFVKQRKSKFLLVELLLLGFIVGVTVWGYYDILDDFFIMDDFDMIRGHSTFQKFLEHWSSAVGGRMYRPLIDLLFIWDFYWWGWNPAGWHLSNLIFHVFNCLLVYALAKHLTHNIYTGMVAGVLFGLHTSHTEAVTWISARMDVVCATFFLLSVWLFVQRIPEPLGVSPPKRFSILPVICFICAILVKEMAVTLPFVLITYDIIFSSDWKPNPRNIRKKVRLYSPYFLVLVAYFAIRLPVLNGIGGHVPKWFGLFILENLVRYFKFLAIPFTETIFSSSLFVNVAGIALIVGVHLLLSKKSRFLILWILLTLTPVYMFSIGRGVYIASVGFCILLGMLLTFTVKEAGCFSQTALFHTGLRLVQIILIIAVFYHYGITLRGSNAWWSQVAEINEKVPLMAKTMYPTFPKNARICLHNVPLVFNQRFNAAFKFRYPEAELAGVYVEDFEVCAADATSATIARDYYFFHYRDGVLHDFTYETRERLTSPHRIDIQRFPRRPEYDLSAQTPHLALDLDAAGPCTAIGLVTALAYGSDAAQGTVVAHGQIEGRYGEIVPFDIIAGQDTAEWAIRFPEVREHVRHAMPQPYRIWTVQQPDDIFAAGQNYMKYIEFDAPLIPTRLTLDMRPLKSISPKLTLDIDRVIRYTLTPES